MQDLRYYIVMADYNHWMNIKLYSVCSDIPDEVRQRDVGGFFKSLHGGLNHLLVTDRIWLDRFQGRAPTFQSLDIVAHEDFASLRQERERIDQEIQEWVNGLSVDWLKQPFTFESKVDGQSRTLPGWLMAVHLFNHQTHHRGQISTLLHQLGYAYGVTDLPWLPSLQALD